MNVRNFTKRLVNSLMAFLVVAVMLAMTAFCSGCVTLGQTEYTQPDPLFPGRYRTFNSNGHLIKEHRPDPLFPGRIITIK